MFGTVSRSVLAGLVGVSLLASAAPAKAAEPAPLIDQVALAAPLASSVLSAAVVNFAAGDAESTAPSTVAPRQPSTLRSRTYEATPLRVSLYVSFAALQALDATSTLKALRGGAHEANPLMQGVAGNTAALLAVKAGTAAATIFFSEHLAKKNPIASLAIMVAVNSAYATIVAHNYRVAGGR